MASPILVQSGFQLGIRPDAPRDAIGQGAYRLFDWIPGNGAPLRKRGGYGWASADLSALSIASYVSGVAWAPFSGDEHLIALSEAGKLYNLKHFTSTDGTYIGSIAGFGVQTCRPFWFRDRVIILPGYNASPIAPQKYYASGGSYTVGALGGSPPIARAGYTWEDYVVLLNCAVSGTNYANRAIYSATGDSETWNTGGAIVDFDEEVVGGTTIKNVQVVFTFKRVYIITGDSPPPGGNLDKKTHALQGCFDPRSIVNYKDWVIWANAEGVWRTDGASPPVSLTDQGDLSIYYRSLVSGFKLSTGWSAAGGVIHGVYFLTIIDNLGNEVATLCYDLERGFWYEHTGIKAAMYAERYASGGTATAPGTSELFTAHRGYPRVGSLAQLWLPDSTNANDADGTAVQPSLETTFYKLYRFWHRRIIPAPEYQRVRRAFLGYDLRALDGTSPYLTVGGVLSEESTSYETYAPTLPATTSQRRLPVNVMRKGHGLGLKISQVGASSDTRIYGIEMDGHTLESRKG